MLVVGILLGLVVLVAPLDHEGLRVDDLLLEGGDLVVDPLHERLLRLLVAARLLHVVPGGEGVGVGGRGDRRGEEHGGDGDDGLEAAAAARARPSGARGARAPEEVMVHGDPDHRVARLAGCASLQGRRGARITSVTPSPALTVATGSGGAQRADAGIHHRDPLPGRVDRRLTPRKGDIAAARWPCREPGWSSGRAPAARLRVRAQGGDTPPDPHARGARAHMPTSDLSPRPECGYADVSVAARPGPPGRAAPSFSGLGRRPFTALTRVRIPLGSPGNVIDMQGPVAQLVSVPPCHGGGRGFKSRQGRHGYEPSLTRGLLSDVGVFSQAARSPG